MPVKGVIVELWQKRATYRAIAELLTQHRLPMSKTAIAVFCHEVLGEIVRPRRRPGRKRHVIPTAATPASTPEQPTAAPTPAEQTGNGSGNDTPSRSRGPRTTPITKP